jgi:CAAX amino terminal protease family.
MKEMVKVNETRAGGEKKGILSRFQEDGFLKAMIALVFFEVLHLLLKILLPLVGVDWGLNNSGAVVREIILKVIPVVILSIVFKTSDVLKNTKNFGKSLLSGLAIIIYTALYSLFLLAIMLLGETPFKSVPEIIMFVLFVFLVGFSEELLCRGIMTETMLRKYGNTKKGIWLSILVSSVGFGLLHFSNILMGQSVIDTVVQVIATTFIGVFFNAIYVRHRNVYAIALIHGLIDFVAMFIQGVIQGNAILKVYEDSTAATTAFEAIITVLVHCLFLVTSLVILRKKKLNEVIENQNK